MQRRSLNHVHIRLLDLQMLGVGLALLKSSLSKRAVSIQLTGHPMINEVVLIWRLPVPLCPLCGLGFSSFLLH